MPKLTPMQAYAIAEGLLDFVDDDLIAEYGEEGLTEAAYEQMVLDGTAWTAPGRVGREAAALIEAGVIRDPRARVR